MASRSLPSRRRPPRKPNRRKRLLMNNRLANGALLAILFIALGASSQERKTGLFEDSGDVGQVGKKGTVNHDAAKGAYTVSGGGENMWAMTDAFQFVWKRMSADVSISADIRIPDPRGN